MGRKPMPDDAAAFAEAVLGARKLGGAPRVSPEGLGGRSPAASLGGSAGAFRRAQALGGQVAGGGAGVGNVGNVRNVGQPGAPVGPTVQAGAAGEAWSARADGVDHRVLRRLRAGQVPVEGELDLHGLTRARAVAALDRFLAATRGRGQRCVVVIHGRGLHSGPEGAALREVARATLLEGNHAGAVLACCTAPPALGGAGATLVWLRR